MDIFFITDPNNLRFKCIFQDCMKNELRAMDIARWLFNARISHLERIALEPERA